MPKILGPLLVADSGCTHTMAGLLHMFQSITYYDPNHRPEVTLGDNSTCCEIHGYGYIVIQLKTFTIRLLALYVPALGDTTLLSIKQHMQWRGAYFHARNHQATLAFPSFAINMFVHDEIECPVTPAPTTEHFDFDEATAIPSPINTTTSTCRLIKQNILEHLPSPQDYYQFTNKVTFQQLAPDAVIPTKSTPGSIGYDVRSIQATEIEPGQIARISTGLAIAMPSQMYLRIAPRSSLSLKHITIEGGVVDSDYRGEIQVILKNNGTSTFSVLQTDRIAQFIFEIAASPCIEVADTLPPTKRATGGFGSTNPVSKRMTHQSFRLDKDYILTINNSNPFQPVARKIKAPICDTSTTTSDDVAARAPQQLLTSINSHNIENPTEEIDPSLQQTVSPIPTNSPSAIPSTHPTPSNSPTEIPTPTCNEAVNTTLPKKLILSQDALHRAVGFYNTHNLLKHIHDIGCKTVQIQQLPKLDQIDPGETASMPSQRHQTKPSTLPKHYSDIWHMDIGHGPCTAIGGARYTLLLVDKATRFKFVFGLTNLTTSLLTAMKRFIMLSGIKPKLIRTDFDSKLIGGDVESFLLDQQISVEASPPYRQHQNGLVERHWQSILSMSRNWLRSSMLPSKYWFFAVKRAVEISNIMPTKHKKTQ